MSNWYKTEIAACLDKLRLARESRIAPRSDTNLLTDWNSMASKAFLDGYSVTGDPGYLRTGLDTLRLTWERAWDGSVVHHVWDGERAKVPGFLSDYAHLAQAHLAAFFTTGDAAHLRGAGIVIDLAIDRFMDASSSALFDSAAGGSDMDLPRTRETGDGVLPSPLATFSAALWKFERITGRINRKLDLKRILEGEASGIAENPGAHPLLADIAEELNSPPVEAVISAKKSSEGMREMLSLARSRLPPHAIVLPMVRDRLSDEEAFSFPIFAGKQVGDTPIAYLCRRGACLPPADNILILNDLIAKAGFFIRPPNPVNPL